jgi:hypothetical protein
MADLLNAVHAPNHRDVWDSRLARCGHSRFLTTRPPFITNFTRSKVVMSRSGSPVNSDDIRPLSGL